LTSAPSRGTLGTRRHLHCHHHQPPPPTTTSRPTLSVPSRSILRRRSLATRNATALAPRDIGHLTVTHTPYPNQPTVDPVRTSHATPHGYNRPPITNSVSALARPQSAPPHMRPQPVLPQSTLRSVPPFTQPRSVPTLVRPQAPLQLMRTAYWDHMDRPPLTRASHRLRSDSKAAVDETGLH
jgi:hypothetical protein